ncbi:MAG TPA: hypothetical protein VMY99_00500 [Nevskiaceae bacterium]|nr:hypothetical protein [Nevskiaceae bacterium]
MATTKEISSDVESLLSNPAAVAPGVHLHAGLTALWHAIDHSVPDLADRAAQVLNLATTYDSTEPGNYWAARLALANEDVYKDWANGESTSARAAEDALTESRALLQDILQEGEDAHDNVRNQLIRVVFANLIARPEDPLHLVVPAPIGKNGGRRNITGYAAAVSSNQKTILVPCKVTREMREGSAPIPPHILLVPLGYDANEAIFTKPELWSARQPLKGLPPARKHRRALGMVGDWILEHDNGSAGAGALVLDALRSYYLGQIYERADVQEHDSVGP